MKPYPAYKKLFNIAFIILLLASLSAPVFSAYAETAQELQGKINERDADIQQLEREIAAYQAELENIGEQKNSLSNSIKQLDVTRKKLNTDISLTQKKIDKTNLNIQSLSSDISSKQSSINNNTESIKLEIRKTHEYETNTILENLLSENDFTTFWNDIDNIATVREKVREYTTELKEIKVELEDTRAETITAKNQLTRLKSQLGDQQKIVIQNTNEKNKLLKETKNSEANYQKLLKERIAERDAF